jgi:hypothetical protein
MNLLLLLLPFIAFFSPEKKLLRDDPCKVYGKVYFEKSRSFTTYSVFEESEDYASYADVTVFKEDNKLFADQAGLWYVVDDPAFADYILYITRERSQADFTIAYTDKRSYAGCRK